MTGFKASIYRRERKYRPSASYRKEEENGNGTHEKWFRPISSKFPDRKSALDPWRADDRRNARRMKITLTEKKETEWEKERKHGKKSQIHEENDGLLPPPPPTFGGRRGIRTYFFLTLQPDCDNFSPEHCVLFATRLPSTPWRTWRQADDTKEISQTVKTYRL